MISENGTETSAEEMTRARISVSTGKATRPEKMPYRSALIRASFVQCDPAFASTMTEPPLLVGVRPQTCMPLPERNATKGNRKARSDGFACPPTVKKPDWYGDVRSGSSWMRNQIAALTPTCHMRYSASETHRSCRAVGTPSGSGGLVSQLNSVTQNCGGRGDEMVPALRAPARRLRIFDRSPIEASFGLCAWWFGPPSVYALCDQMSKRVRLEHVRRYGGRAETQSNWLMN